MRFAFFAVPAVLGLLAAVPARADVFINELHYDNVNTDTSEKVEVMAPAGTSLAGWSVVLYNGTDGKSYATLPLSGTVANQCNGYGTIAVAATGIQNGAPDGVALVNASGALVQLLSYEGTFTATNGPASGHASTAIPQSETSSTAAGTSLQLAGSGSHYADFTWQASRTSSFGACNTGQTPSGGSSGGGGSGGNVLQNGVAATRNLQMKGVNAAVLMEGSADIDKETQDLRVLVVPEIDAGTAALVATAINPAIGIGTFIAQLVLKRPLIKAATREFHVGGSWADPQVTQVKARSDAGAAGAASAASAPAAAASAAEPAAAPINEEPS